MDRKSLKALLLLKGFKSLNETPEAYFTSVQHGTFIAIRVTFHRWRIKVTHIGQPKFFAVGSDSFNGSHLLIRYFFRPQRALNHITRNS